jgi:hypothetical protein
LSKFLKGNVTISELENMPNRYIQSIYKQYTLFLKDQKAQESMAAEDMMEELEDGGMPMMGSANGNEKPNMTSREEQLAAIYKNIKMGEENPPDAP